MQSAIFFTSPFVSLAVMKISMNYFYSQKKNIYAYLIVYLEPIIVLLIVFVFPIFMGTNGIWISQTIAQIIPAIIAIIANHPIKITHLPKRICITQKTMRMKMISGKITITTL